MKAILPLQVYNILHSSRKCNNTVIPLSINTVEYFEGNSGNHVDQSCTAPSNDDFNITLNSDRAPSTPLNAIKLKN